MLQNPRLEDYQEMVDYLAANRVLDYGGEDMFQIRSVKVFFDGALGSRGAAFYEDYADDPGNTGVFEIRPKHLYEVVRAGLETGMQVAPHAIGTRGNGVFLDQVEQALSENPVEDHRFRWFLVINGLLVSMLMRGWFTGFRVIIEFEREMC